LPSEAAFVVAVKLTEVDVATKVKLRALKNPVEPVPDTDTEYLPLLLPLFREL
jgi:hypothetical protein